MAGNENKPQRIIEILRNSRNDTFIIRLCEGNKVIANKSLAVTELQRAPSLVCVQILEYLQEIYADQDARL